MTLTTPSPISDQAADLLEKAALVCENMACAPQFEPEIQDRMLRAAAKSIRALATAPTTESPVITMLPGESLAEYQHRMLNLHIHISPVSPTAQSESSRPVAVRVCPISDIECASARECESVPGKCRKLAASASPAASVLTDDAKRLLKSIASCRHSMQDLPVGFARSAANSTLDDAADLARALLAASTGDKS